MTAALSEAIILAGGLGTRLRGVVSDVPKPLAPIAGRPFLDWLLADLARTGFTRAILATGFGSDAIETRYRSGWAGLEVAISREAERLGTGGAIRLACAQSRAPFTAVLNGDSYSAWDPAQALEHLRSTRTDVAVVLKAVADAGRYGSVTLDAGLVTAFHEKRPGGAGLISAGIYVLDNSRLDWGGLGGAFSFEQDLLTPHAARRRLAGVICPGPFIDIGVPDDFARAQQVIPGWLA